MDKSNKTNLKSMGFYQEQVDGNTKVVVEVQGVKNYFDSFDKAIDFHRAEYTSFEKEGFGGIASLISFSAGGLTKGEMRRALGKYYQAAKANK